MSPFDSTIDPGQFAPPFPPVNTALPQGEGAGLRPLAPATLAPGHEPWARHWVDRMLARLLDAEQTISDQRDRIAYLESITMTDELTGLLNRRGVMNHLERELDAARRNRSSTGVLIMIDLDRFKEINDVHGHLAGDAYLREIGRFLRGRVRTQDVVGRLGGDEFVVLLTRAPARAGLDRARAITEDGNAATMVWHGVTLPLRFSAGAAAYDGSRSAEQVLEAADCRLYRNKARRCAAVSVRSAA